MITKYYQFAGVEIAAHLPKDKSYDYSRTLDPFSAKNASDSHNFYFEMVDELTPPKGECVAAFQEFHVYVTDDSQLRFIGTENSEYMRVEHIGKNHYVQLRKAAHSHAVAAKTLLNAMEAEHLIARAGGAVFHCSYIEHNGKAILFTAPSCTGKSTQAELWHKHRNAEIINGDRAALRVVNGELIAEGIPFAGSSEYCKNRSLPIAAIVYLGQDRKTTIRRVCGYEAFFRIWEGCSVNTWDKCDVETVSDLVKTAAETIPVYYLKCTPDESAVIALEQALIGDSDE